MKGKVALIIRQRRLQVRRLENNLTLLSRLQTFCVWPGRKTFKETRNSEKDT